MSNHSDCLDILRIPFDNNKVLYNFPKTYNKCLPFLISPFDLALMKRNDRDFGLFFTYILKSDVVYCLYNFDEMLADNIVYTIEVI